MEAPRNPHSVSITHRAAPFTQNSGHAQIAPSTVEVHRRNIMRKVGLHKVADLTRYAIRNQLVQV